MNRDEVGAVLDTPMAREVLETFRLARIGYDGLDGLPRVVPIAFWWDGARVVVCTPVNAPKVRALQARPRVALTIDNETGRTRVLLIRGTATLEFVDGIPDEFVAANTKRRDAAGRAAFEGQARALYDRMVRISIEPEWAKLIDFETTLPQAIEEIVRSRRQGM